MKIGCGICIIKCPFQAIKIISIVKNDTDYNLGVFNVLLKKLLFENETQKRKPNDDFDIKSFSLQLCVYFAKITKRNSDNSTLIT